MKQKKFFSRKTKPSGVTRKPWKITQSCLDLILESAKSMYPQEFGGLLRRDTKDKNVITEVVLLPGTISGDAHAIFRLHMLPIDFTIVGTVHSHPSPSFYPSDADLHLFEKFGSVHIIAAKPYSKTSWMAYDHRGKGLELQVL
jgi:proteasome lid subunit RPN8/RPN11